MPQDRLKALKRAILYLKYIDRIQSDTDLAHETGISSGMLSGMLNGKKRISEDWLETFETLYKLKIQDPFSYVDLDWLFPGVKGLNHKEGLTPKIYIELYQDMKGVLQAREARIEAMELRLQGLLMEKDALKNELQTITEVIRRYEEDILEAVKRKHPKDQTVLSKMLKNPKKK
jgi:transcriptional regulator with XRE-family HTH domain